MPLSASEQYLLELINRGRLDPAAEAARYGIDLNADLAAGTITTAAKQALAPNARLENAAIGHSQWMLATDKFDHTGANGSSIGTRASAAGYQWNTLGENIAVWGTTGTVNLAAAIDTHHRGLFLSAGHRTNLMGASFDEVGLAQETGRFAFTAGGTEYNASMLTENFGNQAGTKFLTGVVYDDANGDGFYSVGEGRSGTTLSIYSGWVTSEAAGGYAMDVGALPNAVVRGVAGGLAFSATVDFSRGNVKFDVVNGLSIHTSANLTLGNGINTVKQLGVDHLNTGGNAANNDILGNRGSNSILGHDGHDLLNGGDHNDALFGGTGNDQVIGGNGDDRVEGNAGIDYLVGGLGQDSLNGGLGNDQFVFANTHGADIVEDFVAAQGDVLMLNTNLFTGNLTAAQVVAQYASVTGVGVVFNFGDGDTMTLQGVTSTAGLSNNILFW